MTMDLETTNLMLGIMAAVSVLQAIVLIGLATGGLMAYRRVMRLVADLEARQVAPLREKVDAILVDVKAVTARVAHQTERVDHAIAGTMERVDETATRVSGSLRDKVHQITGLVRGIRAVIVSMLGGDDRGREPRERPGQYEPPLREQRT